MPRAKTKTADNVTTLVPEANQKKQELALQPDPVFSLIERASRDATIDIDKMERLIAMHERMKAGNARQDYDEAMSLAQAEMKTIRTNLDNNQTKSKYASYSALDKAIRPLYTKHGFALSFNTGDAPGPEVVRLLCTVSHRGGHRQEYRLDMPADGKGAKGGDVMTKTHATGAAITYAKRYLAGMVFNLSVGNDDDGNAAGDRAKAWTDVAIQHLNTTKWNKATLEKYFVDNGQSIAWLRKNAPEEHERFHTAWLNANQGAGVEIKEPRRNEPSKKKAASKPPTNEETSPATSPDGEGGQQEPPVAGGVPTASSGQPAAVSEKLEFDDFKTAREFLDFSSGWLDDPKRTPGEARQWEEQFRAKIKEYAEHKFGWIKEAMASCIVSYSAVLAKEQPK